MNLDPSSYIEFFKKNLTIDESQENKPILSKKNKDGRVSAKNNAEGR